MHDDLLLVGSIPLDTAEQVFRAFGPALGAHVPYLPDGEIGERRYWIDGVAYRVLNGHPELETLKRPAPDANGVESWRPLGIRDQFAFRVKPGVARVRFGDPGWRLGYTRDAVNSYFVFKTLKKEGVIPPHVRFQVCLPLTESAVTSFFPDAADHARIMPGFNDALRTEIAKIVELIPPEDLAIQWDLAVENRYLEATLAREGAAAARREAERTVAPAAEICPAIPSSVALGFHSCFGTLEGWPSRRPNDLTGTVMLINACVAAAERRVDFVHFPTLASSGAAFFAPLADLDRACGRVYVGAIHHLHDAGGLAGQIAAARKYLPEFGLAAPCGFGRAPERPGHLLGAGGGRPADPIATILADHRRAVEALRRG
jgi:hypothetical protein